MKILTCDKCGSNDGVKTYERNSLLKNDAQLLNPKVHMPYFYNDGIKLPIDFVEKELCDKCVHRINDEYKTFVEHYLSVFN